MPSSQGDLVVSPPPPELQGQQPGQWTPHSERYFAAWRTQMKLSEYEHLRASRYYQRMHVVAGSLGAITGIGTMFTQVEALIDGGGSGGSGGGDATAPPAATCVLGSTCMSLRITSLVFGAFVLAVLMVLLVHKPAAIAGDHLTAANSFNRLGRSIDITLLQARENREPFWAFAQRLIEEYEALVAKIPTMRVSVDHDPTEDERRSVASSGVPLCDDVRLEEGGSGGGRRPAAAVTGAQAATESDAELARFVKSTNRRIARLNLPARDDNGLDAGVSVARTGVDDIPVRWLKRQLAASSALTLQQRPSFYVSPAL